MPYRLSEIAARFGVHYYPIVSSARAFNALWKRAYSRAANLLGGVVYEDPWLAGGHNGLSNTEDPLKPEPPFPRVRALRELMRTFGLGETPIIMAGGVWWLEEWEDWIDNPELGPIAFQFGTRPLLTRESPIGEGWKAGGLLRLREGDVFLNHFSPTGFFSSAINNGFLRELRARNERQVAYAGEAGGRADRGIRRRARAGASSTSPRRIWTVSAAGSRRGIPRRCARRTARWCLSPPEKSLEIVDDQTACMGCLSQCRFSNWSEKSEDLSTRQERPTRAASASRRRCRPSAMAPTTPMRSSAT